MVRIFGMRCSIGAAVIAAVVLAPTACDGGQQLAGDGDDGGGVPDAAGDGADGSGEADDGTPGDGIGDTTAGCVCLNALDECTADGCFRPDYTCNALHGCDVGYECGPDARCRCVDATICGFACSATVGCPDTWEELVCASDEVCRPALPCGLDAMCPPGQLCIGRGHMYKVCATPGTGAVGASCAENTDCAEGVCHTGICLHRCLLNSDCDSGLLCGHTDGDQLGCMVTTECTGCSGAGQYCFYSTRCRTGNCASSGDCSGGDCMFDITSPTTNAGECETGPMAPGCADEEFASMMSPETCFIPQACWLDSNCPAPYACTDIAAADGVGVCGRTP